jgi:hypothetical protein
VRQMIWRHEVLPGEQVRQLALRAGDRGRLVEVADAHRRASEACVVGALAAREAPA